MSTFQVNALTRAYASYAKGLEQMIKSKTPEEAQADFRAALEKKSGSVTITEETARLAATGGISTEEMSMEEYKSYIYDQISMIKQHPSQWGDSIAINISEAGFEAMKNDKEYEKWVLDTLKQDFAARDPWSGICGGKYVVHFFGATKEEYHGHSWYPEYAGGTGTDLFHAGSRDSFWKKRMDRQKANEDYAKKLSERRRLNKKRLEQMYTKKALFKRQQAVGAAYEANLLTADIGIGELLFGDFGAV